MARRVILSDDFTGEESEDVSTIVFGLEGKYFEIDLSDKSFEGLSRSMRKYIEKAREITPTQAIQKFKESTDSSLTAMREWARANGYEVGDRGRISEEIQEKYRSAVADMMREAGNSPTGDNTASNEAGVNAGTE